MTSYAQPGTVLTDHVFPVPLDHDRPVGREGWLDRALRDYRVLLLDQRGTGRSTPVSATSLAPRGDAAAQAEYLTHFRADSIVLDAELIRTALLGDVPWSVLGQSFGGFCALSYLSFAPHGLCEVLITGGLPGLSATADDVYRAMYPRVAARSSAHYSNYPDDERLVISIAERLAEGDVRLPDARRRGRQPPAALPAGSRRGAVAGLAV